MSKRSKPTTGEPKSDRKDSITWLPSESSRFLASFLALKKTKKESGTGAALEMSTTGWNTLLDQMNEDGHLGIVYDKTHLQNKTKAVGRDWSAHEYLLAKTGLGTKPNGAFSGTADEIEECSRYNKACRKMFNKPLADFDIINELCR